MEVVAEPKERPMHVVRVYQSVDGGTRWWAEDDLGFTGGADRLSDLVDSIREWAEAEGVIEQLSVRLAESAPAIAVPDPVHLSETSRPNTSGVDAIRVGFQPAAALA
ncbi:hypothetical protein [Candidatus Poriferisodalis sp.]|uniref:hypothetical protein n=1 Tax=Candidatus Poriferisodalis sp. TaxID=3101277 RepID=UPI003B5231B2